MGRGGCFSGPAGVAVRGRLVSGEPFPYNVPVLSRVPWLTLAGLTCLLLEQRWERRTRQEIEAANEGAVPPLMAHWLTRTSVSRGAAARVYRRHFDAEMRMSRAFATTAAASLGLMDAGMTTLAARLTLAAAVVAVPASKLVAKPLFNEVEAGLPGLGVLALLREEEVVWALAAELATETPGDAWPAAAASLRDVAVPTAARLRARALDLEAPRVNAFLQHEDRCRATRVGAQRRWLFALIAAAAGTAIVGRLMR